jgi:hypothetical protein
LLIFGALSNTPVDSLPVANAQVDASQIITLPKDDKETDPKVIEDAVRAYFKNDPVMVNIARCESHFRQYDSGGNVLQNLNTDKNGKVVSRDIGVMQINDKVHLDKALNLDVDIYSLEGNMAYAKYLYELKGTQPWNSSYACWGGKAIAKI